MSSSVWFKFMSQKDPTRVTFDGTGIAVFNLKKEIIQISKLGDGTDLDLHIYNQDTNEEYDDDTFMIPRSSSVVARRLPAAKPGQGRAARYVKGSMPVTARPHHQHPNSAATTARRPVPSKSTSSADVAQTEQEKIQAILDMGGAQWEQDKQNMSTASRVPFQGFKQKNVHAPDDVPPPTYICHRCEQKGHWIQNCPTNNDPSFDGKPKIKRVTGIPRSMLKSVEDTPTSQEDGLVDEARQPTSVMVNAEGDRVVAIPDNASWEQYQEKTQASNAQKDTTDLGDKELQERGLECSIDKRMFVNPMKTPCCGKTYCYECIDNALTDRDLICPNCETEGVILEDLERDEEMIGKIKAYEDEKKAKKAEAENEKKAEAERKTAEKVDAEKNDVAKKDRENLESTPGIDGNARSQTATPASVAGSKKRSAEEELNNDRKPDAPADMQRSDSNGTEGDAKPNPPKMEAPSASDLDFVKQMDQWVGAQTQSNAGTTTTSAPAQMFPMNMSMGMSMPPIPAGMPSMPFNMFGPGMPVPPMPGMNAMNMGQMPPMPMPNVPGYPQWNMGNGSGMYGGPNSFPVGNMQNNSWSNWNQHQAMPYQSQNQMNYPRTNSPGFQGYGPGYPNRQNQNVRPQAGYSPPGNWQPPNNANQQQQQYHQNTNFRLDGTDQYPNSQANQSPAPGGEGGDDDAYMRKPVNPHRHGKQKRNRPQDYRELG